MEIRASFNRVKKFLTIDIWGLESKTFKVLHGFPFKQVRVGYLIIRDLFKGNLQVWAGALTYRTILSVIPFFALMFVIAKTMGLQSNLLTDLLPTVNQAQSEILAKAVTYIEKTNVRALGLVGLGFLLWMSILLLFDIEDAFNEIWGVKQRRSMYKRVLISLAIIITCPVFLISTSVVNAFLAGNVQSIPVFQGFSRFLVTLSQYFLVGLVFAGVYTFVPFIRVRFFPALLSGLAASIAWHFTQWVFIEFQVGVSRYNAIYGTFASLPLFLLWIYTSWFIILFGCEFCFASQNERQYAEEKQAKNVSFRLVEQLALGIYFLVFRRDLREHEPYSAEQIGRFFDAPIRVVQDILFKLGESGLVTEVKGGKKNPVLYIPGENKEQVRPLDVVNAVHLYGVDKILQSEDKNVIMKEVHNLFDKRDTLLSGSDFNKPFRELVQD